jgi:hypothetical protein
VSAVAKTRFSELIVGDGAALKQLPSCRSDVVPGEYVPFSADSFAPGAKVDVRVAWERGPNTVDATVTAGKDGRARGWVRVPPGTPTDRPAAVRVSGKGASGGDTIGYAAITATKDATCERNVRDAGLFSPPSAPPPSGGSDDKPSTGKPSNTPGSGGEGGALALTGTGGWLKAAVPAGVALIAAGVLVLIAARRRRAT